VAILQGKSHGRKTLGLDPDMDHSSLCPRNEDVANQSGSRNGKIRTIVAEKASQVGHQVSMGTTINTIIYNIVMGSMADEWFYSVTWLLIY